MINGIIFTSYNIHRPDCVQSCRVCRYFKAYGTGENLLHGIFTFGQICVIIYYV